MCQDELFCMCKYLEQCKYSNNTSSGSGGGSDDHRHSSGSKIPIIVSATGIRTRENNSLTRNFLCVLLL